METNDENLNISGYFWPIFKVLDIFDIYTEPGFRNTHWFDSYLLIALRNDQSKSVSLILGHPVACLEVAEKFVVGGGGGEHVATVSNLNLS